MKRTHSILLAAALLVLLAASPGLAARWSHSGTALSPAAAGAMPLAGATVSVYTDSARTTPATVWTAKTAGSSGGSVIADDYGRWEFWVDDAAYSSSQEFYLTIASGETSIDRGPVRPIQFNAGAISEDALPSSGGSYNLGSAAKKWLNAYLGNLYLSGATGLDDQSTGGASANPLKVTNGGTGKGSYTRGGLLVGNSGGGLSELTGGATGQTITKDASGDWVFGDPSLGATPKITGLTHAGEGVYKTQHPRVQIEGKALVIGTKRIALSNIVSVFIYDTRNDPDGGAWRFAYYSSWYNEASSVTRGARREFPEVAAIVATTNGTGTVDIYDTSTAALWMRFNGSTGWLGNYANTSAATMANGLLVYTQNHVTAGSVGVIDFGRDVELTLVAAVGYLRTAGIINRNNTTYAVKSIGTSRGVLNNRVCNAADIRVVNGATRIAVGTEAGVTVLDYEAGTAWDITDSSYPRVYNVKITPSGGLRAEFTDLTTTQTAYFAALPTADTTTASATSASLTNAAPWPFSAATRVSNRAQAVIPRASLADGTSDVVAWGTAAGLVRINTQSGDETNGASELVATTYRTAPMIGDMRGMWTLEDDPSAGTITDKSRAGLNLTAVNLEVGDRAAVNSGDLYGLTLDGVDEYLTGKVYHDQANSGASFSSAQWSAGSAAIVITDTDTDLTAYQTTSGESTYRIWCSDGTNQAWGYVRGIVAAGSDYTITINNSRAGGTQNWLGAPGSMGAVTAWAIYKAAGNILTHQTYGISINKASAPGSAQTVMARYRGATDWAWRLQINTSGYLVATVSSDGSAAAATATGTASVCDGLRHLITVSATPSGSLTIYVDGEQYATTTGVPASLYESSAPLSIGRDGAGNYLAATFSLPWLTAEAISAGQARRLFERVAPWYNSGARIFLSASNVVKGLSWDPTPGWLVVAQDSGSTGAIDIFDRNGVRISTRTTANSDDYASAITSNRMVAAAAAGGVILAGSTAEAWIEDVLGSSDYLVPGRVRTVSSADRTVSYESLVLMSTGSSTRAVTFPPASTCQGKRLTIKKTDSGAGGITLTAASGDTIESFSFSAQYKYATWQAMGTTWHLVANN